MLEIRYVGRLLRLLLRSDNVQLIDIFWQLKCNFSLSFQRGGIIEILRMINFHAWSNVLIR